MGELILVFLIAAQLHVSTEFQCDSNSKRYQIITSLKSWDDAKLHCQGLGRAHLAVFETDTEYEYVRNLNAVAESDTFCFWVGLSDTETEGTWKWISEGESDVTHDVTSFWGPLEPNGGIVENCAGLFHLSSIARDYGDYGCEMSCHFICEMKKCQGEEFVVEKGHRLQNHLIHRVKVKKLNRCTTRCIRNSRCRSVNLVQIDNETDDYWCELNDSLKGESLAAEYIVSDGESDYAEMI